jgi:hypothetical protein
MKNLFLGDLARLLPRTTRGSPRTMLMGQQTVAVGEVYNRNSFILFKESFFAIGDRQNYGFQKSQPVAHGL